MAEPRLTYEELAEIVARCTGVTVEPAALEPPTVRFEELDVDSLGVLSIVAELERRHRLVLGPDAEDTTTPRELLNLVNDLAANGE
ncbi:acyl carrier protein [Actinomadura graeca]|uniref:Acyl carrier protein n=1 Tax=Actinomadura graeca TaxID=2750812 RepID=A0ABX8QUE6_9ACTN|nr:acyl carrier protein [Actinomadura graeca]QXJ21829.1 acyl carrier protein [Actinomadura graeca]